MEDQTINNVIVQAIVNFNINVFINLLLYSAGTTFGVLVAMKILEAIIGFTRFIRESKYSRSSDEIKELNGKMHDRLVELKAIIEINDSTDDLWRNTDVKTIVRKLRYNSSRLIKFDTTIAEDVEKLLELIGYKEDSGKITTNKEVVDEARELIKQITNKVDNLWS